MNKKALAFWAAVTLSLGAASATSVVIVWNGDFVSVSILAMDSV